MTKIKMTREDRRDEVHAVRIRQDGQVAYKGGLVPSGVFFAALAQRLKAGELAREAETVARTGGGKLTLIEGGAGAAIAEDDAREEVAAGMASTST